MASQSRALTVRFPSSTATLAPDEEAALRSFARAVRRLPRLALSVEGHTDRRGERDLNERLSWLRAQAVAAILIAEGIPAGRISTRGLGSSRPADVGDAPEAWAHNRRVQVLVMKPEAR